MGNFAWVPGEILHVYDRHWRELAAWLGLGQKKRLKSLTCRSAKTRSPTNNPSVMCDVFDKGSCTWEGCGRSHKCKKCRSKEHEIGNCTKRKWWVNTGGLGGVFVDDDEIVHTASFIAINDDFSLLKFMNVFPCLPISPRPNTTNRFQLVDALQQFLQNSLWPRKSSAYAEPLNTDPSSLQIDLPMILYFRAQLGYKCSEAFILSNNPASALVNTEIIDKKLANDLRIGRVDKVAKPTSLFISSPPKLKPKHDGD